MLFDSTSTENRKNTIAFRNGKTISLTMKQNATRNTLKYKIVFKISFGAYTYMHTESICCTVETQHCKSTILQSVFLITSRKAIK